MVTGRLRAPLPFTPFCPLQFYGWVYGSVTVTVCTLTVAQLVCNRLHKPTPMFPSDLLSPFQLFSPSTLCRLNTSLAFFGVEMQNLVTASLVFQSSMVRFRCLFCHCLLDYSRPVPYYMHVSDCKALHGPKNRSGTIYNYHSLLWLQSGHHSVRCELR